MSNSSSSTNDSACIQLYILLVSTSLAAAQLYITHTAEGGKEETQILSMQISSQLFSSFKTLTSSHRIPSTSSTCLITNDFLLIDRWLNKAAALTNKTSNTILSVIQREYEAIFCYIFDGLYSIQNRTVVIFVLLIILQLRDSIARFIFDFTANHILYEVVLSYIEH